jgi:hypothetical protein
MQQDNRLNSQVQLYLETGLRRRLPFDRIREMTVRSITELYREFEAGMASIDALSKLPTPEGTTSNPTYEGAVRSCIEMAWRIVRASAGGIDEMLIKIKVAAWCIDAKDLAELDHWTPGEEEGEEVYALASLRDDLLRLQDKLSYPAPSFGGLDVRN